MDAFLGHPPVDREMLFIIADTEILELLETQDLTTFWGPMEVWSPHLLGGERG